MTKTVYLHVGGPKSGTTYIQQVLEQNRDPLASAGVLVAGPRLDLIHAAMVVREDARLEKLPPAASEAWQRVVRAVRAWDGESAIISYELFANASAEQARRALADLEGLEVHVVVSARDLGKSIPSSWQEQLKFGLTKPLEEWQPPAESAVRSEWGWRTMQPANVAARWGADLPPEQVHVVTVPARGAGSAELWSRFSRACGLEEVAGVDPVVARANESLGVVEAELLRRVNVGLAGRVEGGRQKSLWLRDLLAHRVLAPIGREPIGLTPAHLAEAEAEAEKAAQAITEAGYRVHGDLADLRPDGSGARLPGDVADNELVESAALAMADLLVWARGAGADPSSDGSGRPRSPEPAPAPPLPDGVVAKARHVARISVARAAAGTRDRRVRALERRIAELEDQVETQRALHLRVASLQDLVAQLLLPAAQQDSELTAAMLRQYRTRSL